MNPLHRTEKILHSAIKVYMSPLDNLQHNVNLPEGMVKPKNVERGLGEVFAQNKRRVMDMHNHSHT